MLSPHGNRYFLIFENFCIQVFRTEQTGGSRQCIDLISVLVLGIPLQ